MDKRYNEKYQETLYTATLESGMEVVIWSKKGYVSSSALIAVPYGSLDYRQRSRDGVYEAPCGAAHFLEHKLFEDDQKDIMGLFTAMGANVNAFTSYNETVYYFDTGKPDIREPLKLLLDFVQSLNITAASVEKEKGIITQELLMYQQMPDTRLFNETFRAVYQRFPLRIDIGGSVETVKATTVDDLYECYHRNYHPANMHLVIVTEEDPEVIMAVIRADQAARMIPPFTKVRRCRYREPAHCASKRQIVYMDVNIPKACLAFKLPVIKESAEQRLIAEWSLRFLLEAYFTGNNPRYQEWLDAGIITDYFGYDIDLADDYGLLMFYNESNDPDLFAQTMIDQLRLITATFIDDAAIELLRRRYYGQAVRMFDNVSDIGVTYIRSLFNHIDLFAGIETINKVDSGTIRTAYQRIEQADHTLTVIMKDEVQDDGR